MGMELLRGRCVTFHDYINADGHTQHVNLTSRGTGPFTQPQPARSFLSLHFIELVGTLDNVVLRENTEPHS